MARRCSSVAGSELLAVAAAGEGLAWLGRLGPTDAARTWPERGGSAARAASSPEAERVRLAGPGSALSPVSMFRRMARGIGVSVPWEDRGRYIYGVLTEDGASARGSLGLRTGEKTHARQPYLGGDPGQA